MRRVDLQAVAEAKLSDARFLLAHGRYGNAYYLAGYAVEIALKACIARQIVAEAIPNKRFIDDIYNHDLRRLVGTAGLTAELDARRKADEDFGSNWTIVCEWRPEKRYVTVDANDAGLIVAAIDSSDHGVLEWIRAYW